MIPKVGQIYRENKQSYLCVGLYEPIKDVVTINRRAIWNSKKIVIGAPLYKLGFTVAQHQKISSTIREPLLEELLTSENLFLRVFALMQKSDRFDYSSELLTEALVKTLNQDPTLIALLLIIKETSYHIKFEKGLDVLGYQQLIKNLGLDVDLFCLKNDTYLSSETL